MSSYPGSDEEHEENQSLSFKFQLDYPLNEQHSNMIESDDYEYMYDLEKEFNRSLYMMNFNNKFRCLINIARDHNLTVEERFICLLIKDVLKDHFKNMLNKFESLEYSNFNGKTFTYRVRGNDFLGFHDYDTYNKLIRNKIRIAIRMLLNSWGIFHRNIPDKEEILRLVRNCKNYNDLSSAFKMTKILYSESIAILRDIISTDLFSLQLQSVKVKNINDFHFDKDIKVHSSNRSEINKELQKVQKKCRVGRLDFLEICNQCNDIEYSFSNMRKCITNFSGALFSIKPEKYNKEAYIKNYTEVFLEYRAYDEFSFYIKSIARKSENVYKLKTEWVNSVNYISRLNPVLEELATNIYGTPTCVLFNKWALGEC